MADSLSTPSSPPPDLGPFPSPASDYPIVIVQHRYSAVVPADDEMRWSLMILTTFNLYKLAIPSEPVHGVEMAGQAFAVAPQSSDTRETNYGQDISWTMTHSRDMRLSMVNDPHKKCLGGVKLGSIAKDNRDPKEVQEELAEVVELMKSHQPIPKSEDWDCRDWLLEVVGLLRERQGTRRWVDVEEQGVLDKEKVTERLEIAMHKTEEKNGRVNWKVEAEGGFVFGGLGVTRKSGGQKMLHVPIIVGLDMDTFIGAESN